MAPSASRSSYLLQALGMLGVGTLLFAWQQLAAGVGCAVGVLFLLCIWMAVGAALGESALLRRRVFIAQYLHPQGRLARWLGRKVFLIIWQGIKGLFLALILTVGALLLDNDLWVLLFADILVLTLILHALNRVLASQVRPELLAPLVRIWAQPLNSLLLWLGTLAVIFLSSRESFDAMAWADVVRYSASRVEVGCDVFGLLARVAAAWDASLWWAAQRLLAGVDDRAQALAGWLGFLASFAASLVFAWAYSRALLGVVSRPWRLLDPVD